MKDKLLYLTIGVLVGVVIMQWTVSPGPSASANLQDTGIVAAYGRFMMDQSGMVWELGDCTWVAAPDQNPPVPVAEIKFWTREFVVTNTNHVWRHIDPTAEWVECGPWPGAPVPVEQSSFGTLKSQYKGDGK